jgi:hypothetical protein
MDDLKPAFGEEKFFFEQEIADMEEASLHGSGSSGQIFQSVAEEPPLDLGTASLTDVEAFTKVEPVNAADADMLLEELKNVKNGVTARGMHTDTTAR